MQNNKLLEAIINFERSYSVSKSLANRNQVPYLVDSCRRMLACNSQLQIYKSVLASAEVLYRRCLPDSAIKLYQRANTYACQKPDPNMEKVWQDRINSLLLNSVKQNRFQQLVAKADQLLESNRCNEAIHLYQQADSIQVDCQKLDKSILRIADCKKCIAKQCFDSLMLEAVHSKQANFRRDELRFYRAALACPAPDNKRNELERQILYLECLIENKNCPPPPLTIYPKSIIKPSLLISGNHILPSLLKSGQPERLGKYSFGYSFGVRVEKVSFASPVDFLVDISYKSSTFSTITNQNFKLQDFQIGNLEIEAGIKLHKRTISADKIRGFLSGGISYSKPIDYRSNNYYNSDKFSDVNDLSTGLISGNIGIGIDQQKLKQGFSLSAHYSLTNSNLFNVIPTRTAYNAYNFSAPYTSTISLRASFRLW